MDLTEFIRKKYGRNLKPSEFIAKEQMVLRRIHGVFESFKDYIVQDGARTRIICNEEPLDMALEVEKLSAQCLFEKLVYVFMFTVMNYYAPNPKSKRKSKNMSLDELFSETIDKIYCGSAKLDDPVSKFQENVIETRVRLGLEFEDYLSTLSLRDGYMKQRTKEFCKKMLEYKREAFWFFNEMRKGRYSEEELENKTLDLYIKARNLHQEISYEDYGVFITEELMCFDPDAPSLVIEKLEKIIDIDEVLFEDDAKNFYQQFRNIITVAENRFAKSMVVINDINGKEKAMLNYLLDEFGKNDFEESSAAKDRKVLNLMKTNQWEKISFDQRERLLFLIMDLIEEDFEEDYGKYTRLNKYIRAQSTEDIEYRLMRIEFKLKFPEIYRINQYLEKLHALYGNIGNAEDIMVFLPSAKLNATEQKLKEIFDKQADLYRYCEDSEELAKRVVKDEDNICYSSL